MTSLFSKLKQALAKTSDKVSQGIEHIFIKKKLDAKTLEELEELLITSDISHSVVSQLINDLKALKFNKEITVDEVKTTLAESIIKIFEASNRPINLRTDKLNIILVCGVNGNGKTTTIGKLSAFYKAQGKKVGVVACDTFRAAAVEQLKSWTNRAGVNLFTGELKADPASVVFTSIEKSLEQGIEILFIDTAGRLHNHKNLMDELAKIVKIIKKFDIHAPLETILVIDATSGQNTFNQVHHFSESANISGLIITKLDGSARAGVAVGIVQKFKLPIFFIGIGEKVEDLKTFEAAAFSKALIG